MKGIHHAFCCQRIKSKYLSRHVYTRRRCNSTLLTPEEAGQRAQAIAQKHQKSKLQQRNTRMETILAHAGVGGGGEEMTKNAPMAPPLALATTYTRPATGPYMDGDSIYSRQDNPTRLVLEREMARIECMGEDTREGEANCSPVCCAFASGMMAVSSIVLAHRAPLVVILPNDLYHGVPTVLADVFERFQVTTLRVDLMDTDALKQTLQDIPNESDVIVWMETPSNPLLQIIDIQQTCQLVQTVRSSATTVVDSTLSPPTLTQALRNGADLAFHSGTKYLGGHSDVLLGVVTASPWTERGRAEIGPRLAQVQTCVGGVASAMDSWLTLRGLRTLSVRVKRQCDTALQLATYLEKHPSVLRVHYPGLESHSRHDVATRQMHGGYGGVFSLEFDNEARAMAVAGALGTVQRATSLGGTETLIEHRASIEPVGRVTSPAGLLRVSVGLEDPADLTRDFEMAIEIADGVLAGEE